MTRLKTSVRVRAEGLGIILKNITTFLILFHDSKNDQGDLALVAFAMGQLIYSLAMIVAYMYYFGPTVIFPDIRKPSKYVICHVDSQKFNYSPAIRFSKNLIPQH